jgi:hypothetical protein
MEPVAMLIVIATELLLVGIGTLMAPKVERRYQARLESIANRLQMVDILILCAIWDGVVTDGERHEIEKGFRKALNRHLPQSEVDSAIQGWMAHFGAETTEPREASLRRLSTKLTEDERRETFDVVTKMLGARGPRSEVTDAPFRGGSSPHRELVRTLGAALAIAPAIVEQAVHTVR